MTILTSLYELSQIAELSKAKVNVQKRLMEIKDSARKVELNDESSQHDLRMIALFDNCTKRKIYAIGRLEDIVTLQIIAKRDKNLSIREEAQKRLESL